MERRKFIEITGSYSVLATSDLLFACDKTSDNSFEDKLKKKAILAFKRFEEA